MAAESDIIGHVDGGSLHVLTGWAYDPATPFEPVELEVLQGAERILLLKADHFREDLLGLDYGDGCHAFSVDLPVDVFTQPRVELRVCVRKTGRDLMGSPLVLANERVLLDGSTLQDVGGAIASAAATARSGAELHGLATWLLRQLDLVWGRQAALEASARARSNRFFDLVGENMALSDVLRQAGEAVVAKYPPLHLPDVAQPEVSVIIPAYNNFAYTYRCLAAVLQHRPDVSMEVIVVDDGSTDETLYAAFVVSGGIRLVRNGGNLGFVGSVNAGAAVARGTFLFLLNNDTEVKPGWLDELWHTFQRDAAVGVAGSKLLYPDGKLQEAGGIVWRQGTAMNWGRGDDPERPEYCFMRDADYVSGAALMIPRALFQAVGGLTAALAPAYYDDTDLCFKVRAAGRRVVMQPLSQVVHHEGVSAGADPDGQGMKRFQRVNHRRFLQTWLEELQHFPMSGSDPRRAAERLVTKRALFIDEAVPMSDQDAGSNAALSHMQALQRLGYQVSFVPAESMAKAAPYTEALQRDGIVCYYSPYYWSVEEIFRRETVQFDLFYIHRLANMTKYASMIRQRFPHARIVFNVADLHHLRHERAAQLKASPALQAEADQLRGAELAALATADGVIVHSSYEKTVIARAGIASPVHVLPWTVPLDPDPAPFDERAGFALIGGYKHGPNVDAAEWLVGDIVPLVQAAAPGIECFLIGSHMPDALRRLERPGVVPMGFVPDLAPVLRGLRLTVAPLRYGAGLKGKVLTSLAAGVPCVMTRCAAEGMDLPEVFAAAIGDTAEEFAACILRLHEDQALHAALRQAGLDYIAETCSAGRVDALLAAATGAVAPPMRARSKRTARPAP
jgi:GT2 family glycosyltransferase/glycosyltransferase involved in cell wall biosynthesis